ncbi:MAG: hypothetical protein GY889_01830 [Proteobacteria bacterium]|nr:hypothetical protein [Pseudomonadota bacterium]HJP06717.1 hypothetical protein [Arenicellales bacterium]
MAKKVFCRLMLAGLNPTWAQHLDPPTGKARREDGLPATMGPLVSSIICALLNNIASDSYYYGTSITLAS